MKKFFNLGAWSTLKGMNLFRGDININVDQNTEGRHSCTNVGHVFLFFHKIPEQLGNYSQMIRPSIMES